MYTNYILEVYKVDISILRILLSSFVLNNISFLFCSKGKSFGVGTQKHDKMTKSVSSWVPVPVMSCTFM